MSARRVATTIAATAALLSTGATAASALDEEQACALSTQSYVLCVLATDSDYSRRVNIIAEASTDGFYGIVYQYEIDGDYSDSWGTGAYIGTDHAELEAAHGGTDSDYFGNDRHTYAEASVHQGDDRTEVGAGLFNWDGWDSADDYLYAGVMQEGNGYSQYSGLYQTDDGCTLSAPDTPTMGCGDGGVPENPAPIPFLPIP